MGEKHREQVDLIPDPGAGGDIAERVVGFELAEDPLLAFAAVVEDERLAGAQGFGQDDLELIAVVMRDEEVELDRVFVLLFDASPNEEEVVGRLPGLGFPFRLEVAPLWCPPPPRPRLY
jgi:hypothetical protein